MADVEALTADEKLATGDSGPQVEELQRRLWHLGHYLGQVDGYYGDSTATAVEQFQQAAGVDDDGDVGAQTWERLENDAESAGYDKYADYTTEPTAAESTADGYPADEYPADTAGSADPAGAAAAAGESADAGAENRHWDGTQWLEWDGSAWLPMGGATEDATEEQGAAPAAEATAEQEADQADGQVGQLSEDGQWRWDGAAWVAAQPAAEAEPAAEPAADAATTDTATEPDTAGGAQPAAAEAEAAAGEAKPWAREVMDEIDSPDTEAAPLPSVSV